MGGEWGGGEWGGTWGAGWNGGVEGWGVVMGSNPFFHGPIPKSEDIG